MITGKSQLFICVSDCVKQLSCYEKKPSISFTTLSCYLMYLETIYGKLYVIINLSSFTWLVERVTWYLVQTGWFPQLDVKALILREFCERVISRKY